MTRTLSATAFFLGAIAVIWTGTHFIGSSALALTITMAIGVIYVIGFIELTRFRLATSTLENCLTKLPPSSTHENSTTPIQDLTTPIQDLDEWINDLDPSLQNSVRLRIEGERVGLPAPVLAPYLVGLLIMLGLLGTFIGMVETLKGALIALEGSTELHAIIASLTAPISGLSTAFGTSVAGVAASAMLGLISTLCRKHRILATRQLDSKITTVFRPYSLVHGRQETFKALQSQAKALPEMVIALQAMSGNLQALGEKLSENQESFHTTTHNIFANLANSVDFSLKENLSNCTEVVIENSRLTGENFKQLMKEAIKDIGTEIRAGADETHRQLTQTAQAQVKNLSSHFTQSLEDSTEAWKEVLSGQSQSNDALISGLDISLNEFNKQYENTSAATLEQLDIRIAQWMSRQESGDKTRLDQWSLSLDQSQTNSIAQIKTTSETLIEALKTLMDTQLTGFNSVTQEVESMSSALSSTWRDAGEQSLSQQTQLIESLESTTRQLNSESQSVSTKVLSEITRLLRTSEELVQARTKTENAWLNSVEDRIGQLTSTLKTELSALRQEEETRRENALERLSQLETTSSHNLASLGKALEDPMLRLIETASEAPLTATTMIKKLHDEISKSIERDNHHLNERHNTMEALLALTESIEQSSTRQHETVNTLVTSSTEMLDEVGSQFSSHIETGASKLADISDNFAAGAVDMSSLSDAFGLGVQLFSESNNNLIDSLKQIENALNNSTTRSDEQLEYYVAQARDIIDHSVLSQREVFETLHQLDPSSVKPDQLKPSQGKQKEELEPAEID